MLTWLFKPLIPYFPGLNLIHYVTFRAAFAAILSFTAVLVCAPGCIAWLRSKKIGERQIHDSETLAELHQSKEGVPTMGGVLILMSVTLSVLLLAQLDNPYVVITLLAFLGFGTLGAIDDWMKLRGSGSKGLSEKKKLWAQCLIGLAAVGSLYLLAHVSSDRPLLRGPSLEASPYTERAGYAATADAGTEVLVARRSLPDRPMGPTEVGHPASDHRTDLQVPFFKHFCLDLGLLFLVLGLFVVVGTSNAVNLTDGLDGLAPGCVAIAAFTFAAITYVVGRADTSQYLYVFHIPGAGELTVVCAALAGASLGFLWFNGFPATVFMGDTGSLALGGALGLIAIMARQEFALLVAGGIFVMEVLSVILQRKSYRYRKKRVFRCAPLHHHYQFSGTHEAKVTMRFWIVAVILALFALTLFKLR